MYSKFTLFAVFIASVHAASECSVGPEAKPAGTECRPAENVCDVAEVCDGASLDCPTDLFATTVEVSVWKTCKTWRTSRNR